jgi:hypothetical protein
MTYIIIGLIASATLNVFLIWYLFKVLAKLLYTSDNLGDLYVVLRLYEEFIISVLNMDMYYGEPIIEEMVNKTKVIREEIEKFAEIYSLTTDIELLEEDLRDVGDAEEEKTP